jgi:hypothetical protein
MGNNPGGDTARDQLTKIRISCEKLIKEIGLLDAQAHIRFSEAVQVHKTGDDLEDYPSGLPAIFNALFLIRGAAKLCVLPYLSATERPIEDGIVVGIDDSDFFFWNSNQSAPLQKLHLIRDPIDRSGKKWEPVGWSQTLPLIAGKLGKSQKFAVRHSLLATVFDLIDGNCPHDLPDVPEKMESSLGRELLAEELDAIQFAFTGRWMKNYQSTARTPRSPAKPHDAVRLLLSAIYQFPTVDAAQQYSANLTKEVVSRKQKLTDTNFCSRMLFQHL